MDVAPFSAHTASTKRSAVEGNISLPDGTNLIWGLSRKEFGPMSYKNRSEFYVAENRKNFLNFWDLSLDDLVSAGLDHTNNVQIVDNNDKRKGSRELRTAPQKIDALLTKEKNLVLMTTHADCLPVWLCSPESGWIGMAHAGWRGLLDGIILNFIKAVPEDQRKNMVLAVGPCICTRHYEVGEEVASLFLKDEILKEIVTDIDGKSHLDLVKGVKIHASEYGISVNDDAIYCTSENDILSSFRRDGESFNPMAAFIIRSEPKESKISNKALFNCAR
jgi:purine-nucleoside/S-methyl-5'-thioadenosine phosphorylase / adenosine deaminase